MNRYPTSDEVLVAMGDKVVAALRVAVDGAKDDLATYRAQQPRWVAEHSNRGLANWIHDRMWAILKAELDGVDGIRLVDTEPVREIRVRDLCIRLKRHSRTGAIRSFPTASAKAFVAQDGGADDLLGLLIEPWSELPYGQTLNLTAGYEWEDATRSMGAPVLSLRDGSFEDPIWVIDLPPAADDTGGGSIAPITPEVDGPSAPVIEVRDTDDDAKGVEDA